MPEIVEITAEMDAQIVARLGDLEFTRGELADAFGLVENPVHWKAQIDALIPMPTDRTRLAILLAVEFFTGSKATGGYRDASGEAAEIADATHYHVRAAGYFATVGA